MALVERRIDVTIGIADIEGNPQTFAGANTFKLSDLRTSAKITKAGGLSDSQMQLTIYGMTASLMDRFSTLGMQINLVPKNPITVTAGEKGGTMSTVFVGYIVSAYADFQGAPQVAFNIMAHTLAPDATIMIPATSIKGSADVATLMSGYATQMGLRFENNGVTAKLPGAYYPGSVKVQAQAVVNDAGIAWNGGDNGILAIWPRNGARGGAVPIVSPETGLIGYPAYNAYGLTLKTLFNPTIGLGSKIEVKSSLKPACGTWAVYSLDHDLESQVPKGQWFSMVGAYNPQFPTPVLRPT